MFKTIKFIIILVSIIFIMFMIGYWRGINAPVNKDGQDAYFVIYQGESVKQIGENLYAAGLIKSKLYFEIYAWLTKQEVNFQAGEYLLNSSLSIKQIVDILVKGETLNKEKKIIIIEGWNINDINEYLEKNNVISGNNFTKLAKNEIGNWKLEINKPDFLNDAPPRASLEGYLFPDTYRIYKNADAEDIIQKMLDNFNNKLTDKMRNEIASQGKTIYEIITMASVIEKEVRTSEDMKIVSGIFWNRIKNGQPLESCATIAYILGVNKKQYTIKDTKIDSPYNTYQNPGLPAGPICNPGLNAIKAAIHPKYTKFNYFLNRQDTGETIFSRTLAEHNRNKAKYLK